ncbi:hypothetical protein, unlikely [Trypanosoma brucei gambiense DAL972]|uniref:Uncharacterized protein n=1 Tax=Trypanosoma brucei gambiense (strain MHOM/CI/86/DAL972) TaxID=679716 RepID=D0A5J2_TRYB9|nr:hypothetical protein, unlikely [Trypanosoma brucei gambiense DAL972]CBH16943.1 hypothetical protein, unlikely [Trypanosoma brucei gambiense DAL972]|eukprot:XP_011779207.1 hypothetical protein, unlikely [Trypanosoma brucei gambiense DAL972]
MRRLSASVVGGYCSIPHQVAYREAASATWFGGTEATGSWKRSLKGAAVCLCGIACINVCFRGNALGKVHTESDVYIPAAAFRSRTREPPADGFVDGASQFEGVSVK